MLVTTIITQFKAFARDRQAIFWTLAFPLIFVTAFGLFDIGGDDLSIHTVAVVDYAGNDFSRGIVADLDALESFEGRAARRPHRRPPGDPGRAPSAT